MNNQYIYCVQSIGFIYARNFSLTFTPDGVSVADPAQKIKPAMIKKMAKARLKEEYLAKAKDERNETEEALVVIYGESGI